MKVTLSIVPFVIIAAYFMHCSNKVTTPENKASGLPASSELQVSSGLKSSSPFPIGAAVDPRLLQVDSAYRRTVLSEFNSVTSENVLKWGTVHPSANVFNFKPADALWNFASSNHLRLHGHCLVWGDGLPDWVNDFQGEREDWINLMKTHIQTVVGHFKGRITSWDVVNEAVDYDGSFKGMQTGLGSLLKRKQNVWAEHIGKDYISLAFTFAHEADPSALLFYNDNSQEKFMAKVNQIVSLVTDLKTAGVPIDGIGMQMHMNINTNPSGINRALAAFSKTGLLIHISELDISLNPTSSFFFKLNQQIADQQSMLYFKVASYYKNIVPPKQQYGITFWNVGDKDSWIKVHYKRDDDPLLFDDGYKRKAAYGSFMKGLKSTKLAADN